MAPIVFTVLDWVRVAELDTVREEKGVVAPIAPPKETSPVFADSVNVSVPSVPLIAPVMVRLAPPVVRVGVAPEAKVSAPPTERAVLEVVMFAARERAPLVLKPPFAVMFAPEATVAVPEFVTATAPVRLTIPLKLMVEQADTVRVVNEVELPDPTACKLTAPPEALNVSVSAEPPAVPSTKPERVRVPLPLVSVGLIPSAMVSAPPMVRAVFVVVIFDARLTAPVVLKPPVAVMLPVEFFVTVPEFVIEVAPVEAQLLLRA